MAPIKKMNLQELKALIKQRVAIIVESEAKSLGDPMKVKMNSMTDEGGKLGTTAPTEDPMNGDTNTEAKNGTKDTGAQVKVKAGAVKGSKGPTAGQHTANMEEKSGSEASVKAGGPFTEKPKEGMNKMDGADEGGAKTFVKAGETGVGGQQETIGQKKASFSEDAPDAKQKEKRIADALQMKEGTTFKNKAELLNYIKEEAKKIADLL